MWANYTAAECIRIMLRLLALIAEAHARRPLRIAARTALHSSRALCAVARLDVNGVGSGWLTRLRSAISNPVAAISSRGDPSWRRGPLDTDLSGTLKSLHARSETVSWPLGSATKLNKQVVSLERSRTDPPELDTHCVPSYALAINRIGHHFGSSPWKELVI